MYNSTTRIAKISDFNISQININTNENRKTWVGTVLYMSPERIENKHYNNESDIWSAGIIL